MALELFSSGYAVKRQNNFPHVWARFLGDVGHCGQLLCYLCLSPSLTITIHFD